jgi:hypothetical protein
LPKQFEHGEFAVGQPECGWHFVFWLGRGGGRVQVDPGASRQIVDRV